MWPHAAFYEVSMLEREKYLNSKLQVEYRRSFNFADLMILRVYYGTTSRRVTALAYFPNGTKPDAPEVLQATQVMLDLAELRREQVRNNTGSS